MRNVRTVVALFCAVCLIGATAAQSGAGTAGVLNHIPAGSAGYVVVNNVKALTDGVDKYLVEIGLDKMVKRDMPEGLLAMVKAQAKLGEGFNPDGGFALVVLNPKQFGMGLMEMFGPRMKQTQPPALLEPEKPTVPAPTPAPGDQPAPAPDDKAAPAPGDKAAPPVVLLIPGKGVKEVFAQYNPTEAGEYMKIKINKDAYAAQLGNYIVLSPSLPALEATMKSQKSAATELSETDAKMISGATAAIHVNLNVIGPELIKLLDTLTDPKGGAMRGEQAAIMSMVMGPYKKMLQEIEGLTLAAKLAPTGAVVEALISVKPDSPYAGYFAPLPEGQSLLGKVPDLKYVLAVGAAPTSPAARKRETEDANTLLTGLMKMIPGEKLTEAHRTKVMKLITDLSEQITSAQMVGGGPPGNTGAFGVSIVLSCKDADKFKGLLAEAAATADSLIKELADESETKDIKIAYQKGTETAGGTSVDVITITSEKFSADMSKSDRASMKAIFGEDKIRVLVAAADPTTVVLTFGGGTEMMTKALAAAKASDGTILKSEGVAEAMQHMPKDLGQIVLLNGGNLMDLILAGIKKVDPEEEAALPFKLTCKTPVAIGAGNAKNALHVAIYVPNKLVKEVVGIVMVQIAPRREPPAAKPPGGNDF